MLRGWPRAHRSLIATVTSGSVIAALIAAVAVVSTGYTAQRLDLGDGSVWVSNNQQQAIGRANTEVLELNTVVSTTGNDITVLQSGGSVLLFDRSESKVDLVDPATSAITDTVSLPPDQSEVYLAGDNVVVFERGTGELWIISQATFGSVDFTTAGAQSEATLKLGLDAEVSVDPNGLLFAFAPSTGTMYRVNAANSDTVESTQPVDFGAAATVDLSSVAGRWAAMDPDAGLLYLDGRTVDLTAVMGADTAALLQQPSVEGDRVLVAYTGGLVSVPLSGAAAVGLVEGESGTPARPLVLAGCEFAAWTNGDAWRRCRDGADNSTSLSLEAMAATAQLTFETNGDRAVLNDSRSGKTWAVQRDGELIDNWDDLITADDEQPEQQQNDEDVPPQVETVQQPPVAIDDAFGARPGRATVLPVLLNDFDPNGDVLVVSAAGPIDETVGRVDLINQSQQIQLTLSPAASGQVVFGYTITDGRGGTATATVVVTIRAATENSPPQQVRTTRLTAPSAERVTSQVLGDWVDPDGDAFYLTSASVAAPDSVTYKPEGTIVFSDSGAGGDLKIVSLVVSDGVAEGSGSVSVTVRAPGEVPIEPTPFVLLAYAGQELTVSPLDHVTGGTGTVRLNGVPAKAGATITPSYETGTFRFVSDEIRSHYLEYVVTDGTLTATGTVRIDVVAPPDANTKPITLPKTVFVKTLRNERIDVAGTDTDPAGGVLLVTGITNLPADSGVRAEILEQRLVRVSLDKPLESGSVTFNYRISNGLAEAEGVITVVEIPTPTRVQPPIANDDSVTVRVGDAIDIPVLANDEHPDGLELTVQPKLAQELPADSGLLFASGKVLRYLAPNKSGNFTAAYQVTGPDGQAATAFVHIAVREADVATNNAPVAATVTARVLAGESVRVSIPLAGIDPDGDSVQLLGQSSNPQKGAVIDVESDTIVYQAGDYSAGTDTFTYTVIDALGARSTGTVRVGISPRLDGARNPVAIVDEVTVRPGVTVSVQALANDSDPDGSALSIVSAVPNDQVTTAKVVGTDIVDITPPREPGSYGVIYTIQNEKGGTSQNFIRVTVDADAPRSYPEASDSVLTLSDVLDRPRVTVDVLSNVFFADGDTRSLGLSVYPGYGDLARVTSDKRIEVTVGDTSQIIPFKVTHPDDPSIFSFAFIRVPGFDDALPQLDRRAPALRVNSESQLVINLNDYVIAVGGKQVRLTDSSTVQATHSNGADLVQDSDTLVYTSADKYFGSASISFEVTDGTSATDPVGRTSILVLPITVLPRDNQPPDFNGAVLDFEPGQEKQLDLLKLTSYPYPDDLDELAYSVLSPLPVGFTYSLNGSILSLKANDDTVKGSVTSMSLGVRDALSDGGAGRIELRVVQSTRPLLSPGADSAIARRGQTTTVDVLANDYATNPFPGQGLRVVAIRGLDGSALPAGMQIVPSDDSSSLRVTVADGTQPTDVSLQYRVADATNDPDRYVWGSITISVQDRPEPVANLTPSGFGDRSITLRWNAGAANNSPVTNYRVTSTMGSSVTTTDCSGTTCVIPTAGNGPSNAVTVSVIATNAIGNSEPTTLADKVWSDIIPLAPAVPTAVALDHGLRISWNQVSTPAGGSEVDRYHVTVGSFSGDISTAFCDGTTCTWSTSEAGLSLDNGVAASFTVSPRNAAFTSLSVWNTSEPGSAVPAGPPIAQSSPLATNLDDTTVQLDWAGVFSGNGKAVSQYTAAAFTGTAPTCAPNGSITSNGGSVASAGTALSTEITLPSDATYSLLVFAFNGQGCTASAPVVAHTPPGPLTSAQAQLVSSGSGTWDFKLTGGGMNGLPLDGGYSIYYTLSSGGGEQGPIAIGDLLTAGATQYGGTLSMTARACRTYDSAPLCQSSQSAQFTLGTAVNANVTGLQFVRDGGLSNGGTFSWLGWPSGYSAVEYSCGPNPGTFQPAGADLFCHADASLIEQPTLTIRVTANNGQQYSIEYNGFDYE